MKKVFLLVALFTSCLAFSQDAFKPVLKQGSKINYVAHVDGQDIPMTVSIDSLTPAFLKLGWSIEGYGRGAWLMGAKSIESADQGWWGNPAPDTDEKVADNQQVLIFSKASWNALQKDKKMQYDQTTYTVKQPTDAQKFKVGGKFADAIFVEGTNGTKMWILNDATLPVLLKIEGNTKGPDLSVTDIL